jgi:hypothetical protein
MVLIETGDRAPIVDAGRRGLFALRRIEGADELTHSIRKRESGTFGMAAGSFNGLPLSREDCTVR